MFSYFPGNYVWNLSVCLALECGAQIGDVVASCERLREAAAAGDDAGTEAFARAWAEVAERLEGLADEDLRQDRRLSAADKLNRAAVHYQIAERMQEHGSPGRHKVFEAGQRAFAASVALGRHRLERVEIPYGGAAMSGWMRRPDAAATPAPVVVFANGLDSSKEILVWLGVGEALARRGVATLHLDQPGTGESLRRHGLVAVAEAERWASVALDHLETDPLVDSARMGMLGVSLGGYFAPRAVAYEPRFALGAVWGANHRWGARQRARLANEGERPVPHYWKHVMWVWGATSVEEFLDTADGVTLDGVLDRVRVPFLVTHGALDQQIPLDDARLTYDQLVNSPKRELRVFDERTGGQQHASVDDVSFARDFIADWISETFRQATSA